MKKTVFVIAVFVFLASNNILQGSGRRKNSSLKAVQRARLQRKGPYRKKTRIPLALGTVRPWSKLTKKEQERLNRFCDSTSEEDEEPESDCDN